MARNENEMEALEPVEHPSFADLGVLPVFQDRLKEREITIPTEVQERIIPRLEAGESLVFSSPTGTGKTFAYLLPLIQTKLLAKGGASGPVILICAPTYELCSQIKGEADFLLASVKAALPLPRCSLLIGSTSLSRQIEGLKKDRPLMATGNPGRLLLLARMGKLKLKSTEALILDEGDRLVSDELFAETSELVRLIGDSRRGGKAEGGPQIVACSATFPSKSRERLLSLMGGLSGGGVYTGEAGENEVLRKHVEHWAFFCEGRRKISLLRSFISAADPKKALIFTGRGGQVGNIVAQLQHHKLAAGGLWGDMDKKSRKQALDDFRSGSIRFLVTSDLAARGLDISGISHVIALDISADPDAYVHRAGRTARAGKRGIMVTIGDEVELRRLSTLEKRLGITVYPKELYAGRIASPAL
ncbi:MAG: DEAD/DEAH box helicase [Treponema sp.]|jgi:superfamily II DNA/RNA helicase|nr:DEAD/DEAH box helicase [Treponema sp.]